MAQVQTSFSVSGNKNIVGAINRMLEAIEDEFIYGAEFDYEEDASSMEASVENIDLNGVLSWAALFQTALKKTVEETSLLSLKESQIMTTVILLHSVSIAHKVLSEKKNMITK